VNGSRPIATISRSNVDACAVPAASVHATRTSSAPTFTSVICAPVWMASPCFAKSLPASFAMAPSAAPRNAGSASSTVTSAPSRRQTLPISSPMTPAPTTPRRFGTAGIARAPALSSTRTLSIGTPGSARGFDPVATITCFAASSAGFAPATASFHRSPSLPANDPTPWKNATLFFLNRYRMPSLFWATTRSLRASIFATSIVRPATPMPWSANAWPACAKFSDDCSSAFDGMQPTFVHVPPGAGLPSPRVQSSTHATFMPSCAARIAAM
jgi:hypothetical protein